MRAEQGGREGGGMSLTFWGCEKNLSNGLIYLLEQLEIEIVTNSDTFHTYIFIDEAFLVEWYCYF